MTVKQTAYFSQGGSIGAHRSNDDWPHGVGFKPPKAASQSGCEANRPKAGLFPIEMHERSDDVELRVLPKDDAATVNQAEEARRRVERTVWTAFLIASSYGRPGPVSWVNRHSSSSTRPFESRGAVRSDGSVEASTLMSAGVASASPRSMRSAISRSFATTCTR